MSELERISITTTMAEVVPIQAFFAMVICLDLICFFFLTRFCLWCCCWNCAIWLDPFGTKRHKRRRRGRIPVDPCTPDIRQKCSKRSWDGQVKAWRRQLHQFFTNQDAPAEASSEGNANLPKQTDQNEKENMPNNHQKQQPMGIPGAEYILDTEEAFPAVADPSASMGFFA